MTSLARRTRSSRGVHSGLLLISAIALGCGGSTGSDIFLGADGSSDGAADAFGGSTNDGGPGGTNQSLTCGNTTCAIPSQSCCVYEKTKSYLCVSGATCPVTDAGAATALKCSGAANCPVSKVCCVFEIAVDGGQPVVASDCKSACAGNEAQLCDPSASNTGCGDAGVCSSANVTDWGLPNGYATCGGVGN